MSGTTLHPSPGPLKPPQQRGPDVAVPASSAGVVRPPEQRHRARVIRGESKDRNSKGVLVVAVLASDLPDHGPGSEPAENRGPDEHAVSDLIPGAGVGVDVGHAEADDGVTLAQGRYPGGEGAGRQGQVAEGVGVAAARERPGAAADLRGKATFRSDGISVHVHHRGRAGGQPRGLTRENLGDWVAQVLRYGVLWVGAGPGDGAAPRLTAVNLPGAEPRSALVPLT